MKRLSTCWTLWHSGSNLRGWRGRLHFPSLIIVDVGYGNSYAPAIGYTYAPRTRAVRSSSGSLTLMRVSFTIIHRDR